jgi:P22_AR N-terminal domain
MPDSPIQVVPAMLHLSQFDLEVPVLRVSGMGDYFPVRAFCKAIGLSSPPQVERLQSDTTYEAGLETFTVQTAGGPQPSLCIRKRELAWWLASLEPRTVRKLEQRFGIPLAEFKQSIMDAADTLWWGVQAPTPPSRALQARPNYGEMYLHCLRCKTKHRLGLHGTEMTWEIVPDDE